MTDVLLSRCSDDAEEGTDVINGSPVLTSWLARDIRTGSGDYGISPFSNHLGEITLAERAWVVADLQGYAGARQPVATYV